MHDSFDAVNAIFLGVNNLGIAHTVNKIADDVDIAKTVMPSFKDHLSCTIGIKVSPSAGLHHTGELVERRGPFIVDAIKDGLDMGMDVLKLKVGYGDDIDKENIRSLKNILGSGVGIAVDANRSWSFDQTMNWMNYLRDNEIVWLEEPLNMLDQQRYPELLENTKVPISAGENFLIPPGTDFAREKEWGLTFNETDLAVNIVQPAVVKNCCFSDAVRFVPVVENMGKKLYPHFLGSSPGMAFSAQLASLTNDPHLEWDINPNPMRTSLFTEPFSGVDSYLDLSYSPGIGWEIRKGILEKWTVNHVQVTV